jgi:putative ABC transport system permease protein
VLTIALRSLASHKLRLLLTVLAIVLGISCVSGTYITTDSINQTFTSIFTGANQGVPVIVEGQPRRQGERGGIGGVQRKNVARSVLPAVRRVTGVKDAEGTIFANGADILGPDGKPIGVQGPPRFGGSWIVGPDLSPFHLREGAAPQQAHDVVVDATTAATNHYSVGQQVDIAFRGGAKETFTITGVSGYAQSDNLAGATFCLFTAVTAARVMEMKDSYTTIRVSADAGISDVELRNRVAAVLPPDAVATTGAQAAQEAVQSTVNAINTVLGTALFVFAGITLFVGSFLILNTFTILVAQRTRELALLRALGATRRQVLISVLTEATVTGMMASAIGALAGILIASLLMGLFHFSAGTVLQPRTFIVAIAVGTVVTVAAALIPAVRATRIPPVAALREALPETQPLPRKRIAAGALLLAGGAVLLGLGLGDRPGSALQLLGAGAFGIFVGATLVAPVLVRPLALVLGWPARLLRGVPGRLAGENARRNPRRTSLTSATLLILVALVSSVAVLGDSIKASADEAIQGAVQAQLLVIPAGGQITAAAAATLGGDRSVADVTDIRRATAQVGGTDQEVLGIVVRGIGRTVHFDMQSGDAGSIAVPGTALVDATEAVARNVHTGDTVTLTFEQGNVVPVRIGGVYEGNSLVQGYVVSLETLMPNVTSARDTAILANPAPGISVADAEAAVRRDLKDYPLVRVVSAQEYRDLIGSQIDSILTGITVLLALAIVIAVFGILNTLGLSVLERTRELGLLRALGTTRSQTWEMVAWEAVIIALIGAGLGLALGVGLGLAFVSALHGQGLQVTAVPWLQLGLYAVIAGLLGVLAAVLPAFRAARVDVLRAITTE